MLRTLNSTFVTPFDREDIYQLGSQLDDVMDHMEAVGNLIYLYGLSKLPSLPREMHELIEVLIASADQTLQAMSRLKSMRDLEPYWIEVNRLGKRGRPGIPDAAGTPLLRRVRRADGHEAQGSRRRAGGRRGRFRARGEHGRNHRCQGVLNRWSSR
ncbi:DUF47 domain-containing protein [Fodinicola feengrottensis]|uniref:DUF47 domain-containing protein n=1 Tax=Fodinicola feengrottensis TaxID=435914 RepID=UPI002441CCF3|nr:DUF47 family protein [Fodinicola feengrottensis]